MSARQFLMLGEDPPGIRLELVDGEVAVSPSPRPRHSYLSVALGTLLHGHITAEDLGILLGDTDTIFGEYDVRRPDYVYFSKARMHLVLEDEAIDGSPDLCIELISPSSGKIDRDDKFKQYAKAKVPYYWILDPGPQTIEGYKLKGKKYVRFGHAQGNDVIRLSPFDKLDIPLGKLWFPPRRKNS